jgi:hypothetical protein
MVLRQSSETTSGFTDKRGGTVLLSSRSRRAGLCREETMLACAHPRHSRERGNPVPPQVWIPACAGMTAGLLPTLFLRSAAAAHILRRRESFYASSAAAQRRILYAFGSVTAVHKRILPCAAALWSGTGYKGERLRAAAPFRRTVSRGENLLPYATDRLRNISYLKRAVSSVAQTTHLCDILQTATSRAAVMAALSCDRSIKTA